jgi:predicted lipoprotein with Yx(FWY)xxD motif
MKRLAALLAVASLAIGASTALAASGGAVVKTSSTSLGKILVAGNGRTLYAFSLDTKHKSNCTGTCATSWIPLTTNEAPHAKGTAKAADLGTISRSGGIKQVSYKGHPLYEFSGDTGPGQTNGQGQFAFNGYWYVVSASGATITNATQTTSSSSSGAWG